MTNNLIYIVKDDLFENILIAMRDDFWCLRRLYLESNGGNTCGYYGVITLIQYLC